MSLIVKSMNFFAIWLNMYVNFLFLILTERLETHHIIFTTYECHMQLSYSGFEAFLHNIYQTRDTYGGLACFLL